MGEWSIFALLGLMALAICASAAAIWVALRASATAANVSWMISDMEKSERLTPSKLAELAEFKDSIARAEQLLTKVNRRVIAQTKSRDEAGMFNGSEPASLKDALRKRAGLRAGQPANHQ